MAEPAHFFGIAARSMWQIPVNHAVARNRDKRSGSQTVIETLRALLTEYENAHNRTPNDTGISYYLCVLNRRLAEALEKNGNLGDATEHYRLSVAMLETLAADSPRDFGYHRNAAAAHILYGRLQLRRNQIAEDLENFRRAAELSRYVVENDADNSESQTNLARANAGIGYALILSGRKEGRLRLPDQSRRIIARILHARRRKL